MPSKGFARCVAMARYILLLCMASIPSGAAAQSTTMPVTLRHGSGLLDVPVASVLPHMTITFAYSGFRVHVDRPATVTPEGEIGGFGSRPFRRWLSASTLTLGLYDRAELGISFQDISGSSERGTLLGGHGRLSLLSPDPHGIGLAMGARVVQAPRFAAADRPRTSRLGHADGRLTEAYANPEKGSVRTSLTPYAVASATMRGPVDGLLPPHDLTVTVGWGEGTFRDGADLPWYAFVDSNGFFAGAALHVRMGERSLLHAMGEWNGFDLNLGADLDVRGLRLGAYVLGANYDNDVSAYRTRKWGLRASVSICPREINLCRPTVSARPAPDTLYMPAPPPDTVIVTRPAEPPAVDSGTRTVRLCLATGQAVQVAITSEGDTLVGAARRRLDELGPGVGFTGAYAADADWYRRGEDVRFQGRAYGRIADTLERIDCADIVRVGAFGGVPLFAARASNQAPSALWVPVHPGEWQRYALRPDRRPD